MIKVITYGTYDLLHYGHIRLLERARALGDYLIVGVTADDFDKTRGKINVQQSLMERVEAVQATGLADEIIIEEYEGQKIDDIRRYNVDIFTVGSDWVGKFDYLNEYCKVVYLDRTDGISSSEIRAKARKVKLGFVGEATIVPKYLNESSFVNGVASGGVFTRNSELVEKLTKSGTRCYSSFEKLIENCDAVYIASKPDLHYNQIQYALMHGKHVLCESPLCLHEEEYHQLLLLAKRKHLVLMNSIKTAYSTAYNRLLLLVKGGKIGKVLSVDATCTSLKSIKIEHNETYWHGWNSVCTWGPIAMLPVLQILGNNPTKVEIVSHFLDEEAQFDLFTKINFVYPNAVASIKVGKGVKSEGELVISGTKGYVYVPAPWWKTDYFEVRYENPADNQRYFYQLDGEGIRYELVAFLKQIQAGKGNYLYISDEVTGRIISTVEQFYLRQNMTLI